MEKNINLIDKNGIEEKKQRKFSKKILYPLCFVIIIAFIFIKDVIFTHDGFFNYIFKTLTFEQTPIHNALADQNKINFLLLGIGGDNHDGGQLTDTIMVISADLKDKRASLISIPRDLYVDVPDFGKQKINAAYYLTEKQNQGSGGEVITNVVSHIVGLPIHYYALIDFDGFVRLIDELGGIEVDVPQAFADYQYPDDNFQYKSIKFQAGPQIMTGKQALEYTRSRHGFCLTPCSVPESSDFARSRRQQIILKSLKDKILSLDTLSNPKNLYQIYHSYQDNILTNLESWELLKYYKYLKEIDTTDIEHLVLDDSETGPLIADNINGNYVLLPKVDDFSQVQQLVSNLLTHREQELSTPKEKIALVEILNGTTISGLAALTAKKLENEKLLKIVSIGNSLDQTREHTMIYDLTKGEKKEILSAILAQLNFAQVSDQEPPALVGDPLLHKDSSIDSPDFLIILGKDSAILLSGDSKSYP